LAEGIKNVQAEEDIEDLYEDLNAMITEYDDMDDNNFNTSLIEDEDLSALITGFGAKAKQYTYEEGMRLPEPMKSRMLEAIRQEEAQMYEKGVWEISDMPHHTDAIDTTWVLLKKYDAEGNFIKCKARLVARGFRQHPGRDYEETYAPTPRMATVRLALTLIMALNLEP